MFGFFLSTSAYSVDHQGAPGALKSLAVSFDKLILFQCAALSGAAVFHTSTLLPLSTALKVPVSAAAVKQLNAGSVDHFASCCMDPKILQSCSPEC